MPAIVVGKDELLAKFNRLSKRMETEIMTAVLDAAAEATKTAASDDAPHRTGDLASSIEVTTDNPMQRSVGASQFYARWVEKGTEERETKGGGEGLSTYPHSTGRMPKLPFLKPGLEDPSVEAGACEAFQVGVEESTI